MDKKQKIEQLTAALVEELDDLGFTEKIDMLNNVKMRLAAVSPFRNEPVDCVVWVKTDDVHANDYNPNIIASPEMRLLHLSIKKDGYTQPVVAMIQDDGYQIVDGYHRYRIGKERSDIHKRVHGYLPLTILDSKCNKQAATIRHNRAKGTHQAPLMAHLVLFLANNGWSDDRICKELGMDLDEVIRLKQISGLQEAFQNHHFSKSWEEFETKMKAEGIE